MAEVLSLGNGLLGSNMIVVIPVGFILATIYIYSRCQSRKDQSVTFRDAPKEKEWTTPVPEPYTGVKVTELEPIPYRPFRHGKSFVTMGIRSLDWNEWIEMDKNFIHYHDVKVSELEKHVDEHIKYTDDETARMACHEVFEELTRYLTHRYPDVFSIQDGHVCNALTGERFPLSGITPTDAMAQAAKMVQDDLILMIKRDDGHYHLDAAAVCLPGFWRLREKFRTTLDELHFEAKVPQYGERLQVSMNRFFHKMTPDKAVIRNNFFIQLDGGLHWSHRMGKQEDTEVASWATSNSKDLTIDEIHFRSERQSLRRLPKSKALLFTVRTYFEPVTKIAEEPHVPGRLAEAIRNWTDDVAYYKGKKHWEDILLPYLDEKHRQQVESGILERVPEKDFPY